MARPKATPLDIVTDDADRIRALFHRFANTGWIEAMQSREVADLGLKETDREAVFGILREPLYRGAVRYSDEEVQHEPYRLVDDEVWYKANANLPRERPKPTKVSEQALETLAETLDQATTLAAIVRARMIDCPTSKCSGRLEWDGAPMTDEGVRVPRVRCRKCNYRSPLLIKAEVRALLTKFRCLDCDASGLGDFTQVYEPGAKRHVVTCVRCGWRVSSKRQVFSKLDKPLLAPKPDVAPGQQRLTADKPLKRKAPGRRRRKKPKLGAPKA